MTIRRTAFLSVTALAGSVLSAAPPSPPAPPPTRPVTETLYGTTITDPYRYMETEGDPTTTAWMKAQGRYTRAVFDSIPRHAALLSELAAFGAGFDFVNSVQRYGGRVFYEDRSPGSDVFDLVVRDADGRTRTLVDVAAIRAAHGGSPFAINYFQPSNDGSKVAVGTSEGGSENASVSVIDVASGRTIAGPIPNSRFGGLQWSQDDGTLFLNLVRGEAKGTDTYKNSRMMAWDMKEAPRPVLGAGISKAIAFKPDEIPFLSLAPDSAIAIADNVNGVQPEQELWTAPAKDAASPDSPWRKLAGRENGIVGFTVAGDRIFLLSHQDAPTFKVLALNAGEPLSAARTIVAAQPGRLIEGISAAADGLYVRARRGVYSEVFRVPFNGGAEQAVPLPFKGSVDELFTDPRTPGAIMLADSWATPPAVLAYDRKAGRAESLGLGHAPAGFDPKRFTVRDLQAPAKDGVQVPLTLVSLASAKGPQPLILGAYGSYGISEDPAFATRMVFGMTKGISWATCHVRGGGELGEAWRLGGKDGNKPNTWRDLIACGEALIAQGHTSKDKLFIMGGSAGGITMGRAMEERPDLFAGVFDEVPAANTVRAEFSPNGPPNIPEFGSVTTETGFRNLYAMDSYLHVRDGTQYPMVMITTGLNDPRVATWEPAKLAARLMTTGTKAPVFLRVDEQAGHGIGSTKTQSDALYADMFSMVLWRTGAPGWTPAEFAKR